MAAWMLALALLGLLLGGCASGPGRTSAPGFQDKGESGEGGRNGGMGGGSM
jgi:hypothetical protein